jgi:hypothetical protein
MFPDEQNHGSSNLFNAWIMDIFTALDHRSEFAVLTRLRNSICPLQPETDIWRFENYFAFFFP